MFVTYQLEKGSRCTFFILSQQNRSYLTENTSMVVESHLEYLFKDVGPLRDPLPSSISWRFPKGLEAVEEEAA